jgi:PAS domain S-box-containing protein
VKIGCKKEGGTILNRQVHSSTNDSDILSDLNDPQSIYPVVSEIFNRTFPLILIIGLAALLASLYRALTADGWYPVFFMHLGLYLAVILIFSVRRRFSVPVIFSSILAVGYVVAIQSFFTLGLAATGTLYVVVLCTYAGVFLGLRAGFIALSVGGAIMLLAGGAICTGIITMKPGMSEYLLSPSNWLIHLACYLMYMVPLILSVNGLQKRVATSVQSLKANNFRLEAEISRRNQTEEELKFQNVLLGAQQEASMEGMLVVDDRDMIVSFNRRFVEMWDVPPQAMESRCDSEVLQSVREKVVDPDKFFQRIRALYEHPEESSREEILLTDGRTFDRYSAPMLGPDGRYYGRVWFFRDLSDHRRAEEALRDSEARLRQVIDLVPHFIFAKDRQGRFVLANKAVADAFGTTVENLTGKRDGDFNANTDEVDHFIMDDLKVMDGAMPLEIPEETITDAEGNVRILHTVKIPFTLSSTGDDAILGVSTDITDRKRAEEASRESEWKYRDLAHSLPQAVGEFSENGSLTFANLNGLAMFGYTKDDFEAGRMNVFQLISPQDLPRMRENLERRVRGEEVQDNHEYMALRKDGTTFPILVYTSSVARGDEAISFRAILVDMTERTRIEQALTESETKYRSVVESSFVGFYVAQGNIFRFVNERFCEIFGYARDEIVDKLRPLDLVFLEDRAGVAENLRKGSGSQEDRIDYEFRAVRKDGQVLHIKAFSNKIAFNGENAAAGTLIDVTRERHLEAQLRQVQKMEAVGQLAGGIAHDFNNILTALVGYGNLLQMKMEKTSPLMSYVNHILSASRKASDLTKSLLTFSRQKAVHLESISVNDIILGTEKLLKRLLTEDILLKTNLAVEDVTIMADATQIDQILFNLVTNARDSMPKGGDLIIETKTVTIDADFTIIHGFGQPGRYVLLSISDTGAGMDRATKEKIFDPFFTTKDVGKGTGLGLFTVYGIVKQHNGYIVVYSEVGVGTTFHIYLPVAEKEVESVESLPFVPERGKETILVAEDEKEVRLLIAEVLDMYGYTVIEAVDGQDAIDKFKLYGPVDLVVIDSVMPRKNGRTAYDEIVKINPDVRALFMSGHTRDIVLDRGIEEKEVAFIAKPLSPNELLQKVRAMLDVR